MILADRDSILVDPLLLFVVLFSVSCDKMLPSDMKDSENSITCRLLCVIVKSHMPKSAFYRRNVIKFCK